MMEEKAAGKEYILDKETLKEVRSAEEIREIIQTIENYLVRTKETIDRVEKFVQELKQETKEVTRRENDREKENSRDPDREQDAPSVRL